MGRQLRLLCHPFHNGLKGVDMGAGPLRLIGDSAIPGELRAQGWELRIETIETPDPADPEIVRVAEGDRRLTRRVRAADDDGAFPWCSRAIATAA
ncbi:MAG: hypothetical protein ACRDM7_22355 [Thermoleophilaceae bacterium]